MTYRLTNEQQEALNDLARRNRIEWFAVIDGIAVDLENPRRKSLKRILRDLYEGVVISGILEIGDANLEPAVVTLFLNLGILNPEEIDEVYNNPVILKW